MLKKSFLTISLMLPLVAISAAAHAGSTITDKSYWPNEARRTVYTYGVTAPQNDPSSAFASTVVAPRLQVSPRVNTGGSGPRYHGGPKFQ